jgi:hypothetical protein
MKAITQLKASIDKLPPAQAKLVRAVASLLMGFAAAVVLDYILYRVGLPSKPFIYVAF